MCYEYHEHENKDYDCYKHDCWYAVRSRLPLFPRGDASSDVVSSLQVIGTMVMTVLSAIASSLIVLIFSPIAVAFTLGECGKVLKWYAVVVDDESYCDVEVRNASSPA